MNKHYVTVGMMQGEKRKSNNCKMMLDWNIKTPKTKLQVFGLFGLLSPLQAKQSELRFQKKMVDFPSNGVARQVTVKGQKLYHFHYQPLTIF